MAGKEPPDGACVSPSLADSESRVTDRHELKLVFSLLWSSLQPLLTQSAAEQTSRGNQTNLVEMAMILAKSGFLRRA